MDLELAGKVVIVMAASGGLGKSVASGFAAEGAAVVLAARNDAALRAVAAEIEAATGCRPHVVRTDVTNYDDCVALVRETVERFGRIDVMICNSAGPKTAPFDELDDDAWREALEIKVVAQIRAAREAFIAMKPLRAGVIIFLAGTHGRQPRRYSVTAGVTNAALINASKVLAEAAAPFNIRVNVVNPGPIDTDRMTYLVKEKAAELTITEPEAKRVLADVTLLKRFGEPREVADAVVYLASPRASFVTGIMFDVDGGQVQAI